MSAPVPATDFLTTLWRYFAASSLYSSEHPHRRAMVAEVHRALTELLAGDPVYGNARLRDVRAASWPARMEEAGIGRLEFRRGVEREEVGAFLEAVDERLRGVGGTDEESGEDRPEDDAFQLPHIRFGPLGIEDSEVVRPSERGLGEVELAEEAGAIEWLHEEAGDEGAVPVGETLAIVQSLSVGMHGAGRLIAPFLTLKDTDQYTAGHCINVAILAMSLAEEIGLPAAVVRGIGAAGLLHDVGKVTVPSEILNKPGRLTPEEREIIEQHPVEGCRILLGSGDEMALPAAVAYEHHMVAEGRGYPRRLYPRPTLLASRLVQVCDFYDALRTRRRYRAPLPSERVVGILRESARSHLDPRLVEPFVGMIERWDPADLLEEEDGNGGPDTRTAGGVPRARTADAGPHETGDRGGEGGERSLDPSTAF
jgi:putative nucleotidyltransferase with HDIG domain